MAADLCSGGSSFGRVGGGLGGVRERCTFASPMDDCGGCGELERFLAEEQISVSGRNAPTGEKVWTVRQALFRGDVLLLSAQHFLEPWGIWICALAPYGCSARKQTFDGKDRIAFGGAVCVGGGATADGVVFFGQDGAAEDAGVAISVGGGGGAAGFVSVRGEELCGGICVSGYRRGVHVCAVWSILRDCAGAPATQRDGGGAGDDQQLRSAWRVCGNVLCRLAAGIDWKFAAGFLLMSVSLVCSAMLMLCLKPLDSPERTQAIRMGAEG